MTQVTQMYGRGWSSLIVLYKKAPLYGELSNEVRLRGNSKTACSDSEPFPFRPLTPFVSTNAGWNMVVLLRCRLQYSLFRPILPSLHRPPGALGSNPP